MCSLIGIKTKRRAILLNTMFLSKKLRPFFGNPLSDTFDDPDHSADEQRFLIIGHSEKGRLLFISHTDDGETVRIISAREPTRTEREAYEQEQN